METAVKTFCKNNWKFLSLVALILIITAFGYLYFQKNIETITALKNEVLQKDQEIQEAKKPSEIENIEQSAKDTIAMRDKTRERITSVDKEIQQLQEVKATLEKANTELTLKARCKIDQAKREIEGKEYSLEYCENAENYSRYSENYKAPEVSVDTGRIEDQSLPPRNTIKKYSVYRHEWNDERNDWLSYLYEKSGYDRDIVLTFLSENDNMGLNRPSGFTWYNGQRAYGICQLYYTFHKSFINSADFQDPYKQMDYCIGVWNDAKAKGILPQTFHAYSFRNNALKKVTFTR